MEYNQLAPEEKHIIEEKGTELPFSGEFDDFYVNGFYLCRKCNTPLYRSMDKFNSRCGWPSFDDEIPKRIKHQIDADGRRTEIICNTCEGHLGHVFHGEEYTPKSTRHCVNSLSLQFKNFDKTFQNCCEAVHHENKKVDALVIAGGCFWGIEYFFEQEAGVLATAPGYIGGYVENPSYKEVCNGNTGHYECVAVIFECESTNLKKLYELFFTIHDYTQENGQGPDIGDQYRSAIFTLNDSQEKIAQQVLHAYPNACTQIKPLSTFWSAELEHHHYYRQRGGQPYCHYKR